MAAQDAILCIDIGGDSIKVAEFAYPDGGSVMLQHFAYCEYGADKEDNDSDALADALRETILSNGFTAKKTYISLSGQNAFIRFVKVPAMTTDEQKIKEIIEYEAKQTIPFPMNEVVWDSQLIPSADESSSEIEAMFVIVKSEEIARITGIMDDIGIEVMLIEVAPTACYNSAKANGIGEEQCEMILNIGGKCSTLVFIDKGRFFVRTIPIAGHSITQQISKEFGISFADAEEMKRRHGFVALGGAYEEPESEVAATVSKIVRNVMTRLHGEINRSINVYRAQQKGRKPEKLYLAGGSSVMAFTPRFFQEKLRIPVEYFNPFQIVTLDDNIDQSVLSEIAHMFGETIGLALRKINSCSINISLIPESLRKQNALKSKLPYFYASCAVLISCLLITNWFFAKQVSNTELKLTTITNFVKERKNIVRNVNSANSDFKRARKDYETAKKLLDNRAEWTTLLNEIQKVVPDDIWFDSISLQADAGKDGAAVKEQPAEEEAPRSFNIFGSRRTQSQPAAQEKPKESLNWVSIVGNTILMKSRDTDHERVSSQEDSKSIRSLMTNIAQSPYFEDNENNIVYQGTYDAATRQGNIFSFKMLFRLKKPISQTK